MKILLSIVCLIIVISVIFFVFNYKKIETFYLDNEIGSYSAIREVLYPSPSNISNLPYFSNVYSVFNKNGSLPMNFNEVTFFIDKNNVLEKYNNLAEKYQDFIIGDSVVVSDDYNNFSKIVISNFNFVVPPFNSMNINTFYNTYKVDGEDYAIYRGYSSSARLYRVIMGEIPGDNNYVDISNIEVDIRVLPHLDLATGSFTGNYDITIVPTSYVFEYNLAQTVKVLTSDLETLDNAKPKLEDFYIPDDEILDELNFFEKAIYCFKIYIFVFSHPIRLLQYWTIWGEIIISDLAGSVIVSGMPISIL